MIICKHLEQLDGSLDILNTYSALSKEISNDVSATRSDIAKIECDLNQMQAGKYAYTSPRH